MFEKKTTAIDPYNAQRNIYVDVNSLLTSDGDIDQLHNVLINVKTTLQIAAHDYAKAALGAANEAVKCVQNAEPAGAVWPHLAEYQSLAQKAADALNVTLAATGMLLNSEETGILDIDKSNLYAKIDSVDTHVVSAMLEGATTRFNMAMRGMPLNAKAGQRTNPKAMLPPKAEND